MGAFAWVTLATNDSYSLGALVLAHSLKQVGTAHQLAVLVTPGVTSAMREKLASVFNVVQEVNILDSRDEANLRLLKRPELGITFTKLHCWRLTQFEKCVFLDADTLVLQNSDELFEREELSAAPDVGWPDCFNSGVFVYRPSLDTYEKLIQFALEKGSFDGGDQGLLNLYFSDWAHKDISKHLPFIYNMCSTACYSYLPAFKQFGANAKIIHFIGPQKPWLQYFNTETRKVQPSGDSSHLQEVLQRWWDIFCSLIHPHLSPAMAGLAGAFSQLTLGVARTPEQDALENILRKQAWEVGNIDYLGRDSFENIWSKITETLSSGPPQPEASAPAPEQEVPSAPAESQSQTAPQEEAIPVQTPVLPLDTSTPKIDSIKSSPSVEVQKDKEPKLEASVDTSTEETKPVSSSEVAPADVIKEVVSSPEPKSEVSQGLIEKEPPTESAATPVTEPAAAPVTEPAATPVTEPAVAPVTEPAVAPATEPAAAPLPTPAAAPVTQSASAPVTESTALPLTEPVAKPVTEPAAAPVTEIVAAPVAEPAAAPVVETAQPVAEPVVEAVAKAVAESVAEPLSCPIPPKKDAQKKPSSEPQPIPAQAVAPESVVERQPIATPEPAQVSPQPAQTKQAPLKEPVAESQSSAAPVGTTESAGAPTPSSPSAAEPSAADLKLSAKPAVTTSAKPTESSVPTKSSPKTKVTEATPPATPATPPVEKTKPALTAEATVPDTPPPSEGGSTPTPPPRKTDKPKKAAAKQKK